MTSPVLKRRYTVLDEEARYWKDEELELQIAFHTQRAAQLKRLLNSRRCISRKLPPEILAEVFLFQAVILRAERIAQHLEEGSAATHPSFYKWINVAQVCHHWREVALNCAALWTWFAFEEHITDSFLNLLNDRTRDLPVTVVLTINPPKQRCDACIDINMFSERGFHSIAMIKSLVPRVRELFLFIERDVYLSTYPDTIWTALEDSAPLLEMLHIEAIGDTRYDSYQDYKAQVIVPDPIFKGRVPKLRSLSVSGVQFRLANSLLYAGLKELIVTSCQCDCASVTPLLHHWFEVLRRMPLLEVLKLDWSASTPIFGVEYQSVYLPNLKALHVAGAIEVFLNHIQHLKFPQETEVCFSGHTSNYSQQELARMLDASTSLFQQMSIQTVSYGDMPLLRDRHHFYRHDEPSSCQVRATITSHDDSTHPRTESVARLTFIRDEDVVIDMTIPAILDALDLSRVSTLHVSGCACGKKWPRVLRDAGNVITLRVDGYAADGVPSILAAGVPAPFRFNAQFEEYLRRSDEAREALADQRHRVVFNTADAPDGSDDNLGNRVGTEDTEGLDAEMLAEALASPDATKPIFPRLRSLRFVDVNIESANDGDFGQEPAYGFNVPALVKSLRIRRIQGASDIMDVKFERCSSKDPRKDISPLTVVVMDVRWEGPGLSLHLSAASS